MADLTLTAGVARADITPPVGFRMQGIMRRIDPSVGVESPLLATVLVLADQQTKIVILDCDLPGLDLPLVQEVRRRVSERVGTPATHVMVGSTHTHTGPCTARGKMGGPHHAGARPGEIEALDAYIEDLVNKLSGIAALADGSRQPARVGTARGHAAVAINREELAEDGRVLVGRNPDGPKDHTVDVVRVDDLSANPIAVLTGYAAHPVVMGLENQLISPDFPGVVRRTVEQVTGATCLYLTGAAGNQATLSFLQGDWAEKERTGAIVGCEAAKVFYQIETRPHDVEREIGASISNLALYHKEFRDGPTHKTLSAAARQVSVPLQPLPSLEQAEAQLVEATARLQRLAAEKVSATNCHPALLVKVWAEGVVDKVKAGIEQEAISFDIVGYRLDDFVLVGMPGEPFVEIGLSVKEHSNARHTMFAGYCNGTLAYWPTAETVARGGMAVESAVKSYNISAPPVAETADILVGEFGQLLAELDL